MKNEEKKEKEMNEPENKGRILLILNKKKYAECLNDIDVESVFGESGSNSFNSC